MQQVQLTEVQIQELQQMSRPITDADQAALNQAYSQLQAKGFVFSGDNFMTLIRAYNNSPTAPITSQSILGFTAKFRDLFQWLSAEETEYNRLSAELGPETTDFVIKHLGRHGLVNTAGTEDLWNNFNLVVGVFQSRGYPITADHFQKVITSFQASGGRFSKPQGTLRYAATPDQVARQKRWDAAKAEEQPKSVKELFEIAKAKAASVAHIVLPSGERMSDQVLRQFHERYPDFTEVSEAPAQKNPQNDIVDAVEEHWQQQTKDYIRSLSGQNLLQQEAEQLFGHPVHGSWRTAHQDLQLWHERKKLGVWGRS